MSKQRIENFLSCIKNVLPSSRHYVICNWTPCSMKPLFLANTVAKEEVGEKMMKGIKIVGE